MEYVILTGMSGGGKTTALKIMEDIGYFCVDNLPVALMEKFVEIADSESTPYQKVAFGVDVRSGKSIHALDCTMQKLRDQGILLRMVFLDARDEVIIKRYKESRRAHPLAGQGRIEDGIAREHQLMDFLKQKADYMIDTSDLLNKDLRAELENIFVKDMEFKNLMITVLSFGFKYGLPADSDLVFDVRFLPNPFYEENLRHLTGNDRAVRDYVMNSPVSTEFADKLEDLLRFLIPQYIAEGKNRLVISVGCTGGRHRSVTIANEICERLQNGRNYGIHVSHRDLARRDNHSPGR
ncbi:MAG TPA: RNase adapter RapZ [Lachnospiraceae bacterium]|jgi:UPF0042 nucleotide-binding protein|nr:RNase adapter RapZ [Lachnospiraceae bacterium]